MLPSGVARLELRVCDAVRYAMLGEFPFLNPGGSMSAVVNRTTVLGACVLAVAMSACKEAVQIVEPELRATAIMDGATSEKPIVMVFGSRAQVTYTLAGSELRGPDGRRVILPPDIARRFRALATADTRIRKRSEALAPAWRRSGLVATDGVTGQRIQQRSSSLVPAPASILRNAGNQKSEQGMLSSSVMARTCDEIALDIYDTTNGYHDAQDDLTAALQWALDCSLNGEWCGQWGVLLALGVVELYQLRLEDLAYTYSSQGCWGTPQ
jgi:hypothetical protein